jgi:Arabinose efflux permease
MNTLNSQQNLLPEENMPKKKVWILAFIFSFLALLVDGADLALLAYSLTSLKQEFSLSSIQAGALGSWTLAGMAIGGFFGGWACDRFGRVRVIVVAIALFSSLTFWLGFTQSYEEFKWLRFFSAIGLGALYIACNTLMAEYVPTKYRSTVLAALMTGWTLRFSRCHCTCRMAASRARLALPLLYCHCSDCSCHWHVLPGTRTTSLVKGTSRKIGSQSQWRSAGKTEEYV